jgi:DNA mismatch endonuclease (patch repair protein)
MSGIRGKNTKPELIIRKGLHRRGFRFRLYDSKLPGKPDIVLAKYNAVIFVHGCFWHGHECYMFKWPSTRKEFWKNKIEGNRERDREVFASLAEMGWRILIVRECATRGIYRKPLNEVIVTISDWLISGNSYCEIEGKYVDRPDRLDG